MYCGLEMPVVVCIIALLAVIVLIPYFRIFGKAGFSPWLGLLMVVPIVNVVMLYYLGFVDWPSLKESSPQK